MLRPYPIGSLIQITLYNSLAATGEGHGTQPALIAGLTGLPPEHPNTPTAVQRAQAAGLVIHAGEGTAPCVDAPLTLRVNGVQDNTRQPNAINITVEQPGLDPLHLSANSVGGGNIEITGCSASPELLREVLRQVEGPAPGAQHGAIAPLDPAQRETLGGLAPAFAGIGGHYGPEHAHDRQPSWTALAALGAESGLEPWIIALGVESWVTGLSIDEVWGQALARQRFFRDTAERAGDKTCQLKVIEGDWGSRLGRSVRGPLLCGEAGWLAFHRGISIQELNAAGGLVAAAPTAGASGTVPAAISALMDTLDLSDAEAAQGVLTAGLVGWIAFGRGNVSGAYAGCGAEIGVAAAMAAGGVASILGGGWGAIEAAAALATLPWMGTACAPTGGLVEYPCAPRNGLAAQSSIACAEAGLMLGHPHERLDVALDGIFAVGRALPEHLRETEPGGHNETALRLARRPRCSSCPSGGCSG